jgi:Family of unknown function (DUF5677)
MTIAIVVLIAIFSTGKRQKMLFNTHGLLSPDIEKFRAAIRNVPTYKVWFEFGDELNRLGLDMLQGLDIPFTDNQRLTISALFVRAHKSLQAALALAEIGLVGDARTVLRSAVEGAIALNALANDPKFVDQLIEAHHFNQRKTARRLLKEPDYRAMCSATQVAKMKQTVEQIDAMEKKAPGRKLGDITWANVAIKHCKDLYDLLYRSLSSDGTHATIDSINRMFEYDGTNHIKDLKIGPDIADRVGTLMAACAMFLGTADPFARAYSQSEIRTRIREMNQRFNALPQDEPSDAAVVPNFRG